MSESTLDDAFRDIVRMHAAPGPAPRRMHIIIPRDAFLSLWQSWYGPRTSGYRRQRRRRGYRLFPSRKHLRRLRSDRFEVKLTAYLTLHAMDLP